MLPWFQPISLATTYDDMVVVARVKVESLPDCQYPVLVKIGNRQSPVLPDAHSYQPAINVDRVGKVMDLLDNSIISLCLFHFLFLLFVFIRYP